MITVIFFVIFYIGIGRPYVKSGMWFICACMIWLMLLRDMTGCKIDPNETYFLLGIAVPLISLAVNWLLFVRKNISKNIEEDVRKLGWPPGTWQKSKRYQI